MNNIRETTAEQAPRQLSKLFGEPRSYFEHGLPSRSNVPPVDRIPGRSYHSTNWYGLTGNAKRGELLQRFLNRQRTPGILDQIQDCQSREAAHLLWHEFLDSANAVSRKTMNKATRLLETLEFPLP